MWEESGVALWQTQVGLAGSKTDSLQHTAEPVHHVCDTSLRGEKKRSNKHSVERRIGRKSEKPQRRC